MKTKLLTIRLTFLIILAFTTNSSYASDKKAYAAKENEELYGEGFCSKCSAMCFECKGYFNYVDMIPPDIEAGQEEPVCKECNLKLAKKLWAEFGDVPIDINEDIDIDWREFLKGTNKFTIWHWFEAEYNVSIAKDLQCT